MVPRKKFINPIIKIYATVPEDDPRFDQVAMNKEIAKIISHYLPGATIEITHNEFSLSPPQPNPNGELH